MVSRGRSDRGKKRIPFLLRGLFVPIHRSSAEGAKVVFPFTEAPPPPECTTAGEYTRFAPPEWQPLFRYSPLDLQFRPSIHEIPAFPRNPALFLAIRLAIHRLAPFPRPFVYSSWSTSSRLPSPLPTRVRGFLKTYCRQQPNRASFLLPFRPLPILHRPSSLIPIFLIHAHRASNGVERFTRFRVYHLATLHFSPSFQSFTVFSPCCFPPAGFIRLNSRLAFCYRWLDWMVASARRTHQ